jgi:hypothetical protein
MQIKILSIKDKRKKYRKHAAGFDFKKRHVAIYLIS